MYKSLGLNVTFKKKLENTAMSEETQETCDIHYTRTFDAPRDLVFRVYVEPDLMAQWWAPANSGWSVPADQITLEPRPGITRNRTLTWACVCMCMCLVHSGFFSTKKQRLHSGGKLSWTMVMPSGKAMPTTCEILDYKSPELFQWRHGKFGFTSTYTFTETADGKTLVEVVQENAPVSLKSKEIDKWVNDTLSTLDDLLKTL
jgi:uncharacterized protein YndB with AHSA1/START domain